MVHKKSIPQKSLIVIFDVASFSGAKLEVLTAWYWSAEDAAAWLKPRRKLFPDVSAQELVAMALLPEDVRETLCKPLCGLKAGSKRPAEDRALSVPAFELLSDSCAVCFIHGFTATKEDAAQRDAKKSLDLFELRINRVWPEVMKEESEQLNKFSLIGLEARFRAAYERKKLRELNLGEAASGLIKSKQRTGI